MARPKAAPKIPEFVSSAELARFLGITTRWVTELTVRGVLTKEGRGQFDLKVAVRENTRFQVEQARQASASTSADRLRDARDEQIRIRTARDERMLISLAEAEEAIDVIGAEFLGTLDSIPARITKDESERARIREFLDKERARLSERFAEEAQTLRTGVASDDADGEDDT